MTNLNELSKDIILAIDELEYQTREEKLLKAELLMNISKLLESEESYEKNINALRNAKISSSNNDRFRYDDVVFTKVVNDIIKSISKLNYKEKSMNIDRIELLINISKFLKNQDSYKNNLKLLNQLIHEPKKNKVV